MKETLERYIKFAIENGFEKIARYEYQGKVYELPEYFPVGKEARNLIELITSKEFVDVIAKGIEEQSVEFDGTLIDYIICGQSLAIYNGTLEQSVEFDGTLIDYIICGQSLAIYNGTLEEFVNNLLPKTEQGES